MDIVKHLVIKSLIDKYIKFICVFLIYFFSLLGISQNISFKKYKPCSFSIELPVNMKMNKLYSDSSADYCDYKVKSNDGYAVMELHSLINSRFEENTIKGLYNSAIKSSPINISYKMIASNFFVISGFNKKNGNIVYWKRVLGRNYVSDLYIEYNSKRKADIEPYIGKISKSFISD